MPDLPSGVKRLVCGNCGDVIFARGNATVWHTCEDSGPPFIEEPEPAGDQTNLHHYEKHGN